MGEITCSGPSGQIRERSKRVPSRPKVFRIRDNRRKRLLLSYRLACLLPIGVFIFGVTWSARPVALAQSPPAGGAAAHPPLTFMTEHRPPNNYVDAETGRVVGSSTLILRAVLDKAGAKATFELAPWSRAYGRALTEPNTCVYSTVRNDRREAMFKWVGPLDVTYFFVVARKARNIKLNAIEDARPYRFGVLTQDVREFELRFRGGFTIDTVAVDLLNAQKLLNDRIDLWFTDLETLERIDQERRVQMEVVLRLPPQPLYLACNKTVGDDIVAAMNEALNELGGAVDPARLDGLLRQ